MKLYRVHTLVRRHLILLPQSFDRITDLFFWPFFDLMMWGLTAQWISSMGDGVSNQEAVVLAVVSASVFWRVMWSTSYEVSSAFLEECWNRNLSNLIASPITKLEWVVGVVLLGLLKLVALIALLWIATQLIFGTDFFQLGVTWLICFAVLLCFGWCCAFAALGCILKLGIRAQSLSWTLGFLVAPFAAAYFPLKMLPDWAQQIGLLLPITHAFEGMRSVILDGVIPWNTFGTAGVLSLVYLGASLWFLNYSFERTRRRGFDHLD